MHLRSIFAIVLKNIPVNRRFMVNVIFMINDLFTKYIYDKKKFVNKKFIINILFTSNVFKMNYFLQIFLKLAYLL